MTNQLNIFVAVLFAVAVSSAYNVENKISCEWQPMKLECNRSEVLKIMSANYGRTNATLCGFFENTNCRASRSLSIIRNKCEGQTSCTVMATNYVFGDPCLGVVKYIEAQYQCVPAPACTANQFRCDDGECISRSLLCNGYPDCSEGDDERECDFENKITCEWQPMKLECNWGEVLKIMSANYGRTNDTLCGLFEDTNCRAPGSLNIIKNKCEGQTSCTVMATNYVFGDPCHGVVKYIEAQYQCVPTELLSISSTFTSSSPSSTSSSISSSTSSSTSNSISSSSSTTFGTLSKYFKYFQYPVLALALSSIGV